MVVAAEPEPGMVVKAKGEFQWKRTLSLRAPWGTRQLIQNFRVHDWCTASVTIVKLSFADTAPRAQGRPLAAVFFVTIEILSKRFYTLFMRYVHKFESNFDESIHRFNVYLRLNL